MRQICGFSVTIIKMRGRDRVAFSVSAIYRDIFPSLFPSLFFSLPVVGEVLLLRHCKRRQESGATAATAVIIKQKTMFDADNKEEVRGSMKNEKGERERERIEWSKEGQQGKRKEKRYPRR